MSNEVATNGQIPSPDINNDMMLGGHCMAIVGYNDVSKTFRCANSWGIGWGNKGYCDMPYDYLLDNNLARDFCVITFVY
jgi:C1A family cysteine protease